MSDEDKIQAKGPWVWLKPDPRSEMSHGGIYMPELSMAERTRLGTASVVSAGPGGWGEENGKEVWVPSGISPGDRVVYRNFIGENAPKRYAWDDHCFVHMTDILGFKLE